MARCVYVSCGENGVPTLDALRREGIDIAAVVTIPPALGKRYSVSGYYDYSAYCDTSGLPLVQLESYSLETGDLGNIEFDLLVVNGWNRLIKADVIAIAKAGALGVHAGHPPIGLGRAPLVWNIIHGHSDIEVYVFRLTENADDGDVLASRPVEITVQDTAQLLYEKVMMAAAELFPIAVRNLLDGRSGTTQRSEHAIHYPKRSPADGIIDFSTSEGQLCNFVRAQSHPYPGAFAWLDGKKWTVHHAVPYDRFAHRSEPRVPGRILASLPSGLVVQTGGACLWIIRASVDGKDVEFGDSTMQFIGRQFNASGLDHGQQHSETIHDE